jgi:hypothetical protein
MQLESSDWSRQSILLDLNDINDVSVKTRKNMKRNDRQVYLLGMKRSPFAAAEAAAAA